MQAEHLCNMGYRHPGTAFRRGLGQALGQPSMPIEPRHRLQMASAASAVQTIECQIENHRQTQHGEIPDAPLHALMDLAAGMATDSAA